MIVENMKARIMTPCGLLSLFTMYIGIFTSGLCQTTCPTRCLCYFEEQPRAVICSNQGLEVFPENINDMVEQLNLSNNLLTDITNSDINRLIDLQYLNLSMNKLSSLPDDLQSLRNLQSLDLSGNKIYKIIDINSIRQLPSLMVLQLWGNPLSNLEGLVSASITVLDASYCDIRELTNTSLDGLKALTFLNLEGNPLKLIQKVWNPKLHKLNMSNCRLNYLQPDNFSGLPELEELQLSNNPILAYSTRYSTLTHFNLKKLDVSQCNLDRPGLHGFPSLTYARLSGNAISILPNRIFAKNPELEFLYLNENVIKSLNMNTFEGLVKLQVLDLSMNNLHTIHPLIFRDNVELKLLNLSYNVLYEFPNITSTVVSLDASFNTISNLHRNFLTNMLKIRSINFTENQLQRIPPKLNSTTLRNLDLRKNRIVNVHNDTFLYLPQLVRIDLSGNQLTEAINPEIFRNNRDIHTIKLEDNPWRCDCQKLLFLYSFLTESPAKSNEQTLLCQSPTNVSGYTWLTACFDVWNTPLYYNKDRTWGFVMIALLLMIVLFGSFVSVRHMMRIKRRAIEQRQQLETLRLLRQRRNQTERVQEEHVERVTEPRIHPLELVEPPSYEEAVQMPRLARSLDNLDEISVEMSSRRIMGSVDNIRPNQRRKRRSKIRIHSEDDLVRRGERRHERIRRQRNISVGNNETDLPESQRSLKVSVTRRTRMQNMTTDPMDSASGRTTRSRPQTPSARKKRRRYTVYDGNSTDDEDSDVYPVGSSRSIVIRELRREPKSGYRESTSERES